MKNSENKYAIGSSVYNMITFYGYSLALWKGINTFEGTNVRIRDKFNRFSFQTKWDLDTLIDA